jgi:hypothetical protein
MKRYRKKGYQNTQSYIVGLIVLLAVLVVLLLFYSRTAELGESRESINLCRQQIEVSSIGHIGGMQIYDIGKCPTEYVTIDDVDEDVVKKELADEMASCWYKLGEGEYELFDFKTGTTQYCVICSVIAFDTAPQEINGFLKYLGSKNVPIRYSGREGVSYADYMHNYKSDPSIQLLYEEETNDVIDTSFDYATIFLYGKKGHISKIWTTAAGLAVGTVGGALVLSGVGAPVGVGLLAGSAAIGAGGAYAGYAAGSDAGASWESGVLLYQYNTEALNQLDCEILPVQQ